MLNVILTFVPRQHVLKLNKHVNVNKSSPINIHILIAGVENNYSFGKSERPWAHELTSQTGGELMSWSPSVSAALIYYIYMCVCIFIYYSIIHIFVISSILSVHETFGKWLMKSLTKNPNTSLYVSAVSHCAWMCWWLCMLLPPIGCEWNLFLWKRMDLTSGLNVNSKYCCPIGPVTPRIYWPCKFFTGPTSLTLQEEILHEIHQ